MPQVNVADEGLLVALDSMTLAYLQESPNATKTMVWYLTYLDKDMDGDSENKMDFLVIPSSKIIPNIEKSDGYFSYKDHLFFIGKRNDQRKRQDPVFAYSNTTNSFYYIKINWNLLWNSDIEESVKNQLVSKYASIEDYPPILLSRNSDGLWTWRFSSF